MADKLVLDTWTPMSFKRAMGNRKTGGQSWTTPTWVGDHDRRLQAYTVLAAYLDNAARHFLGPVGDREEREEHREYGDAALIRNQALSALLGDDQRIVVEGADDYNPDAEDEEQDEEEAQDQEESRAALELQEWLEAWAADERFPVKMQECERNAVGLGDGVYVLGWSSRKQRPRLRVFDPGFYFPVLDDSNEDEFPSRVHIAWELPPEEGKPGVRIRRMTWELAPIGTEPGPDGELELQDGEFYDENTGQVTRQLPWNDEPTDLTCYFTDAVWTLQGNASVEDLSESQAEYMTNEDGDELDRLDIELDFIPVIHVSNTISVSEHYGRSSLAYVLQILDDLANSDTDLQAASSTTGTPPIALGGATMGTEKLSYRPGSILEIGDGRMDVLDTSNALDALLGYVEKLLDRISVNGRLPAALLGRVDASEVPSGLALQLSFGPLSSMVREMRLARNDKYSLVFKFAHRMALAAGLDVPARWFPAHLQFGSYLPADVQSTVGSVTQLLNAKAISLETAVRMLQDAGLPIEDAVAEVSRIESRDFEGADRLLDATGDPDAVDLYLGRETVSSAPEPPTENE